MAISRSKIRFITLNDFVDATMARVRPVDALVWLYLYRHADGRNRARVALSQIARGVGVSTATVKRALRRLSDDAQVVAVVRRGGLRAGSNEYVIRGRANVRCGS